MNAAKWDWIVQQVALQAGVSPETVLREMEAALQAAAASPNAAFATIPAEAELPTPQEVATCLADRTVQALLGSS